MTGRLAAIADLASLSGDKHISTQAAPVAACVQETRALGPARTAPAQIQLGAPTFPETLQHHPRYEIIDFLGAGGMGMVFKARHRFSGELAALKMVHPAWAAEPAMVARFQDEISAVTRLCHPNIVSARETERAGHADVLVMEYVPGVTLEESLSKTPVVTMTRACEHMRQAAFGLQHAHEHGLVHRDIKPQNLMLTDSGQIKILDFGLARFTGAAPIRPTAIAASLPEMAADPAGDDVTPHWRGRRIDEMAAGYPLGTVDYLAPEEVEDPRRADIRADIYSLGCTLYRLLTGRVPFPARRLVEKLKAHRQHTPTPVQQLCPEVPVPLGRLVARMMAKDPFERPQTPAEVAVALATFVDRPRRIA